MRLWSCLGGAALAAGALIACGDSSTGGGGAGAGPLGGGGSGGSGGNPLTGDPVKILNWNLHNFFDTEEDTSNTEDDSISQAEYTAKLNAVVSVLEALDPDVIVFAEVENDTILQDINAGLGNVYVDQHISDGHDPRGVEIAALSKYPFDQVVSHFGDMFVVQGTPAPEYNFTRDLLEYHFQVGEQRVVLLGVHYKAKGPPDDPDRRLAEAQRTREVADALTTSDPDLAVLVLGDYNDLPDSPPIDAIIGSDPEYSSATDHVPAEDRWTFNFMGAEELIDHQIGNPRMMENLDTTSVHIEHEGDVGAASDHHPVIATYYLE